MSHTKPSIPLCISCQEKSEDEEPVDSICYWCLIRGYQASFAVFDQAMAEITELGGKATELAVKARNKARNLSEGELFKVPDGVQLGADRPWPPHDFISVLADAADHLLHDHDCDQHGHERVAIACDAARSWLVDFGDCTTTERHGAYEAFRKICEMVEHDSPVYLIAVEEMSTLGYAIRNSEESPSKCLGPCPEFAKTAPTFTRDGITVHVVNSADLEALERLLEHPKDAGNQGELVPEIFRSGFNAGRHCDSSYDVRQAWDTYCKYGDERKAKPDHVGRPSAHWNPTCSDCRRGLYCCEDGARYVQEAFEDALTERESKKDGEGRFE